MFLCDYIKALVLLAFQSQARSICESWNRHGIQLSELFRFYIMDIWRSCQIKLPLLIEQVSLVQFLAVIASDIMTKLSRKIDSDKRKFCSIKRIAGDRVCSTKNKKINDFVKPLS